MRTTRIELEGQAGRVTIERQADRACIRIDAIVREPKPDERSWRTWELALDATDAEMTQAAISVADAVGQDGDVEDSADAYAAIYEAVLRVARRA